MLIFFKIAILGADALCFLLGSQGMNEGAHKTRDLRRTERPILYESSGITESVTSFLWDIVPCTLSVEVSCFDCCGCKCLSHGLFVFCR